MEIQSSNNDTIIEVLSWLPAESLLRFKTVSKGWHTTISDNSFQREQFRRAKPIISGFFTRNSIAFPIKTKYFSFSSTRAIAHPNVLDFLAADVDVAASSNGLLCCPNTQNIYPSLAILVKFIYVCNPATKKFVQIEWPKGTKTHLYFRLVFYPYYAHVDDLPNFKLVCVSKEGCSQFLFQVYTSKTKEWRTMEICQYSQYSCGMPFGPMVFASGVFYLIIRGDAILAFDVNMERSYFISFPVPWEPIPHLGVHVHENCIGESEGQLHYILISDVGIGLYVLNSDFEWELKHFIYLSAMEEEFPHFLYTEAKKAAALVPSNLAISKWIVPLFLKDEILLLKLRCGFSDENNKIERCTKIYLYNLGTKMLEELYTIEKFESFECFIRATPFNMTLAPLGTT